MLDLPSTNFFEMSPTMWGAYGLIGGVGAACILSGLLERKLFGGSFEFVYSSINVLLRIGMPTAYFIMLIRFFSSL
ncbi:hypothetical protein [Metabacillus fastidiosus]|uniref:hypothetical protein n=1 Tax=Metabacillus fastidiosus TaxID=1458 RepID=UPI003D2A9978